MWEEFSFTFSTTSTAPLPFSFLFSKIPLKGGAYVGGQWKVTKVARKENRGELTSQNDN